MSHLSTIQTEIRNLQAAVNAAQVLGIPIAEGVTSIRDWYQLTQPAAVVFGDRHWGFNIGLVQQPNGYFAVAGDVMMVCGMGGYDASHSLYHGQAMLRQFGPDFDQYRTENDAEGEHHYATGHPSRFLQEYAVQAACLWGESEAMFGQREQLENGTIVLRLMGGQLPQGAYVQVTALPSGQSEVAVFGVSGPSCKALTSLLEGLLGQITSEAPTADYYHVTTEQGSVLHVG